MSRSNVTKQARVCRKLGFIPGPNRYNSDMLLNMIYFHLAEDGIKKDAVLTIGADSVAYAGLKGADLLGALARCVKQLVNRGADCILLADEIPREADALATDFKVPFLRCARRAFTHAFLTTGSLNEHKRVSDQGYVLVGPASELELFEVSEAERQTDPQRFSDFTVTTLSDEKLRHDLQKCYAEGPFDFSLPHYLRLADAIDTQLATQEAKSHLVWATDYWTSRLLTAQEYTFNRRGMFPTSVLPQDSLITVPPIHKRGYRAFCLDELWAGYIVTYMISTLEFDPNMPRDFFETEKFLGLS